MTACEDEEDFLRKVQYTSDLTKDDFPNLLCIPADRFNLYNEPSKNLANSIGFLFEQCGGKNSKELEYSTTRTEGQAAIELSNFRQELSDF